DGATIAARAGLVLAVVEHRALVRLVVVRVVPDGAVADEQAVVDVELGEQATDAASVAGGVVSERAVRDPDAALAAEHVDRASAAALASEPLDRATAGVGAKRGALVVTEDRIDDDQVAVAQVECAALAIIVPL